MSSPPGPRSLLDKRTRSCRNPVLRYPTRAYQSDRASPTTRSPRRANRRGTRRPPSREGGRLTLPLDRHTRHISRGDSRRWPLVAHSLERSTWPQVRQRACSVALPASPDPPARSKARDAARPAALKPSPPAADSPAWSGRGATSRQVVSDVQGASPFTSGRHASSWSPSQLVEERLRTIARTELCQTSAHHHDTSATASIRLHSRWVGVVEVRPPPHRPRQQERKPGWARVSRVVGT